MSQSLQHSHSATIGPATRLDSRTPWPLAVRDEAVRRLREGERAVPISNELGVPRETVSAWRRRAGLPPRWTPLPPEADELIRAALVKGETCAAVAPRLGVTNRAVAWHARRMGLVLPRGRPRLRPASPLSVAGAAAQR